MKPIETKTIDDKKVEVGQMAIRQQIKFIKYITSSIGGVFSGLKNVQDFSVDSKIDGQIIGVIMEKLTEIDDEIVYEWIEKLLEKSSVDGKKVDKNIETVFYGDLNLLFKVVYFSLEVNFGDFLSGSNGLTAQLAKIKSIIESKK